MPSSPEVDLPHGDKLGHFLAYGLLMFWFAQLYRTTKSRLAYAAGFVALGAGLELLQGHLGARVSDVLDIYANATGVLLGWAATLIFPKLRVS